MGTEGKKEEEGKRIGEFLLSWQSVYLGKSRKSADLRLFLSREKNCQRTSDFSGPAQKLVKKDRGGLGGGEMVRVVCLVRRRFKYHLLELLNRKNNMSRAFLEFEVVSLDGNNPLDAIFFSLHGRGPGRQLQNQKGLQRHQKEWPQSCLWRVPRANSPKPPREQVASFRRT